MAVTGHSALLQNVSKGDTDAQPNFVSQSFFYYLPSLVEPGLELGSCLLHAKTIIQSVLSFEVFLTDCKCIMALTIKMSSLC